MVEDDRAQELASLQQQLKAAKESLRLIEVRKSEYVLSTDVPLQLTKETEKKQKEIDRLTRQIAELSQAISSSGGDSSESPTGKTEKHEPVSQSDENIPRRAWALVALLIIDLALLFVWIWCLIRDQPALMSYLQVVVGIVAVIIAVLVVFYRVQRPITWGSALHHLGAARRWMLAILILTLLMLGVTALFWPVGAIGQCCVPPVPTPTATSTATFTATPPSTSTPTGTPIPPVPSSPTMTSTPEPCVCQLTTDTASVLCLILAESEAVNKGSLDLIQKIFAPDAFIADRSVPSKTWNSPMAYYQPDFDKLDFANATHFDEVITVTNQGAWATSGSSGKYAPKNTILWTAYSNPNPSDHWTFGKNQRSCWVITRFEFNAMAVKFP